MKRRPRRGEEGFSYIETIVALFIAALSASALAVLVLGLFRAPFSIRSAGRENAAIAVLDRELRLTAARVRGPWWTDGPETVLFPESLRVNWLDGVREKKLFIEIGTGELLINCDDEVSRLIFPESWTPRFAALSPEGTTRDTESGFRLLLDSEGTLPEICASFGTQPLAEDSR